MRNVALYAALLLTLAAMPAAGAADELSDPSRQDEYYNSVYDPR
ncbi:MAG: hypothetical protein VX471_03015 [Acidobacteriota bacterium]|nr:hypothetical protein [Acidobacteriota bacterium]